MVADTRRIVKRSRADTAEAPNRQTVDVAGIPLLIVNQSPALQQQPELQELAGRCRDEKLGLQGVSWRQEADDSAYRHFQRLGARCRTTWARCDD